MKSLLIFACFGSLAFAASPCDVLRQMKGEPVETTVKKKSLGQRFKERMACAAELTQMQYAMREIQRSQQSSQANQTNHNGGSAKYAMDGVSVGEGYYLDRSGSSATR